VTALALSAPGAAQERPPDEVPPPPAQTAPPEPEAVKPAEPTKDLFDLLRELRHKPPPPPPGPEDYKKWMVAAAPVLTYGPTSGFGIGVAGNMAVYRGFVLAGRLSDFDRMPFARAVGQIEAGPARPQLRKRNQGSHPRHHVDAHPEGLRVLAVEVHGVAGSEGETGPHSLSLSRKRCCGVRRGHVRLGLPD